VWPEVDTADGATQCESGQYRVSLAHEGTQPISLSFDDHADAVRVETDAQVAAQDAARTGYGVGCWSEETEGESETPRRGYFFAVGGDGSYVIARIAGDGWDAILNGGPGAVDVRSGVNRVRGDCVHSEGGTTLVLSLNGAEVAVARDRPGEGDFGAIGFVTIAGEGATDVRFDNEDARELASAEAASMAAKPTTPKPSASGLPLSDDFSTPSGRWSTDETSAVSLAYVDGTYRMRIKQPSRQWSLFPLLAPTSTVRVTASATQVAGSPGLEVGVVCYAEENAGYLFAVSPFGAWAILRETPGDLVTVAHGTADFSFGRGQPDVALTADCAGDPQRAATLLALTVNGQLVVRVREESGLGDFSIIGVYARDKLGPAELRFDDFAAEELTGADLAALREGTK